MKRNTLGFLAALVAGAGAAAASQAINLSVNGSGINLTVAFAGEPAKAEKKHDEKALKVIDTYIEKIGGKELIMSIRSMHTSGTLDMPMAGIKGKMEMFAAQPGRMATIMELPGFGKIESGYDGEVGWNTDPMSGPRLMTAEQVADLGDQIDPNSAAKYRERYHTIEHHGEVDFQGQKAHKLRLVRGDNREVIEYFSVESGLLIGQESLQNTEMGEIKVVAVMSDYKEFDGMKTPTKITQNIGIQQLIMTISAVKINAVDEGVFKRPAAVEALVKAQKEG